MPKESSTSHLTHATINCSRCPKPLTLGKAVNDAIRDIEKHNSQLAGVLPKTYNLFTSTLLKELLKKVSEIPATVDYDAFGRILDPACGSGDMFVQSARFVAQHKKNPAAELSIHGVEKTDETRAPAGIKKRKKR